MKRLAIFDIDGTLYKSAFGVKFLRAMVEDAVIGVPEFAQDYERWKHADNATKRQIFQERFRGIYHNQLVGVHRDAMLQAVQKLLQKESSNVYQDVVAELSTAKSVGYTALALSHSPFIAVSAFSSAYGFEHCIAPDFLFDAKDNYIGSDSSFVYDKAHQVAQFCKDHGIGLDESMGFGDRVEDLPVLEAVSRAVATRPEPALRLIAVERDWEIIEDSNGA